MRRVACINDLRRIARRRVPKMFFDYVDGGSWTERTYRANYSDLAAIEFKQRVAIDVSGRSARTTLLGTDVRMPVAMSPTGLTGVYWANGEILAMKACEEFGIPYTLSTVSIASIEDVARAASKPFWFQMYVIRDRDFIARLMDRAEAAGVETLVVTVDLQMSAQRNKDIYNGLSSPPRPTLANIADLVRRPRWCLEMMRARKITFGNLHGHVAGMEGEGGRISLAEWTNDQFDPSLDWDDVKRLRDRWKHKLIVKGVMAPEDAEAAIDVGADALVVSNHGGRQLDGAPSTIRVLPEMRKVVGRKAEILVDSGFCSGQDVFRGVASGADGVMMGRAMLYGLGAGGQAGVAKALSMVCNELEITMGLTGVNGIAEIGPHNLFDRARNA